MRIRRLRLEDHVLANRGDLVLLRVHELGRYLECDRLVLGAALIQRLTLVAAASGLCYLPVVIDKRDNTSLAFGASESYPLTENVDRQHLFLAPGGHDDLSFLGEALATLDVELVLVAQAAHETPARAGDLRGIQRKALVLRDTEVDRAKLRQPGSGAVLTAATPDAVEPLCLVTNADLLQLDAGAEERREIADEVAKVDALFGGEVEREFFPVPLPLCVGELHRQAVGTYAIHALAPRFFVQPAELRCRRLVTRRGETQCLSRRRGGAASVRPAYVPHLRELAKRAHESQVLPTVGIDDDRRLEWRRIRIIPEKKLPAVTLEFDFYEVSHTLKLIVLRTAD